MKQSVSPVVFGAIIVVVVAVVCFFGIRALFPPSSNANLSPTEYKSKMQQSVQSQHSNMDKATEHGPAGAPAGYQEYLRRQREGQH